MKKAVALMTMVLLLFVIHTSFSQITIPPDKEQLLRGEVQGEAFVAEINSFPSPRKILDLKDELNLTKDQLRKLDEMLKNLPISATMKGQDIIEAEEGLNSMFESGNINEKTLRAKLERIGKLLASQQTRKGIYA